MEKKEFDLMNQSMNQTVVPMRTMMIGLRKELEKDPTNKRVQALLEGVTEVENKWLLYQEEFINLYEPQIKYDQNHGKIR